MTWEPAIVLGVLRAACPFSIGVLLFRLQNRPRAHIPGAGFLAAALLIAILWLPISSGWPYQPFAVICLFPLVMLLAIRSGGGRSQRLQLALGRLSYPIYALNAPIIRLVRIVWDGRHPTPEALWIGAIPAFASCVVIGWMVLRIYDEPIRARIRPAAGQG